MESESTDACEGVVEEVVGRRIEPWPAREVRAVASAYTHVVLDVGCGDGRHTVRLARGRPDTLVLGVDANVGAMREASLRASRRPERGGVVNVRFLRSAAETLPPALRSLADEILVLYPWGRLLAGVLRPDLPLLQSLAGAARPDARLRVEVNRSAWNEYRSEPGPRLASAFHAAGWRLDAIAWRRLVPDTTWGRRVGQGRAVDVLCVDATRR